MNDVSLSRRLVSEALGTALLLATVVGSGIMAERLAGGNMALALLCNTIPTGAILVVLIWIFGPLSGAHFNPIVSLAFFVRRELSRHLTVLYVLVQVVGAITGVYAAHLMFAENIVQISTRLREGPAQAFSEFVAAFGLVLTIFGTLRNRADTTPIAVGLYITAAYWFTASTSFANPAVTIARSLTNTFSGIAPSSVPLFIAAQFAGAGAAIISCTWLLPGPPQTTAAP
ncbi:MAG TPA: MIP/aquaporin family protein [Rhizomicrobium sp.]|jgi:glycerol uptake facilitator-like aquaporin